MAREQETPPASKTTTAALTRSDAPAKTTLATLSRLIEMSPDAMLVIDPAGQIALVNTQACELFGYAADQLLQRPLEQLLPERLRSSHEAHQLAYSASPHTRPMGVGLELVGCRQDGAEFPIDISLRPFRIKRQLYVAAAIRDVSAQRQWVRERTELLARLRMQSDLIGAAHDAILVRDMANRILMWNRGAEELYGWTANEALGRVTHVLFKTRFPVSLASIEAQLERDGDWEGELRHTRPDGRVVVVESRMALVRDADGRPSAVLEVNRDITERRRSEEAEASRQAHTLVQLSFLQQLIDAIPNGVYVVHGSDARLVLANHAASSTWGAFWLPDQPMQEFLNTHHIQLRNAEGQPLAMDQWATMRAVRYGENCLQVQQIIHRPNGDDLPVLINAVPLAFSYWRTLDTGNISRIFAGDELDEALSPTTPSSVRVTHHGEGDAASETLALVVQQDVRTLKEAEYLKDEFIALAAHELRTPVAALKGAVETLLHQAQMGRGTPLVDWQEEMLQEIDLATDRLTGLTDELLDVTRLQAGQLHFHPTPTDLVALLKRVVAHGQATTSHHQLTLVLPNLHDPPNQRSASRSEVSSGKHQRPSGATAPKPAGASQEAQKIREIIANVDASRIEQVFANVIMNAIKYSPAGGPIRVTLALRTAEAVAPGSLDDAGERDTLSPYAEIQVQDWGIGIPVDQHSRIFGRFVRADNARQAGINGTGLGLYLSRELVERHGGRIWFASQEGKGTTFFVTLPLAPAQTPPASSSASAESVAAPGPTP